MSERLSRSLASVLSMSFLLASCASISSISDAGDDSSIAACMPGASRACACTNGLTGSQICTVAGNFDTCRCETAATTCVPGMSTACMCLDGRVGAHRCLGNGADFDACTCSGPLDAGLPDAAPITDATADAPVPDGSDGCAPARCDAAAAGCGRYSDGCGGVIDCGSCATPIVQNLHLTANRILADRSRNVIYATVPSAFPMYGGRVAVIDALSARVTDSFDVGAEPTTMAMSEDARVLYVSTPSTNSIRRVDLDTRTTVAQIMLGPDPMFGYATHALDMVVMPGRANRLVASLHTSEIVSSFVAVFEDGVILPGRMDGPYAASPIFPGNAAAIYGFDSGTTSGAFSEIRIDDTGAHLGRVSSQLLGGAYVTAFASEAGYVYSGLGHVIEESTFTVRGNFSTDGYPVPDRERHRVYFVTSRVWTDQPATLEIFDLDTFAMIDRVVLPEIDVSVVVQAIRYAPNGIAFRTMVPFVPGSGSVYLLQSDLVTSDTP